MFLLLVAFPMEFSSAQEDGVTIKVCRPSSAVVIATDGGVVDLSALDESGVARVSGAKGTTENVISELKKECGFTSFVLLEGAGSQASDGTSAVSLRASDKYIDPTTEAILDACNYSVAIVEVQKEDVCTGVSVPVCTGDKKASPWLERDEQNREYLWYRLGAASPWLEKDDRGFVWSDLRASPWLELDASPWLELEASPWLEKEGELCVDDKGYLWSNLNGYLWSNLNGYLWSNLNGYLWSNLNGYLWSNLNGYLWSNGRGYLWSN